MTASHDNIQPRAAAAVQIAPSNVLRFPNPRKRAYPHGFVPRADWPPNVVRLEVGIFAPPEPLSDAGVRWLLTATLRTMTWPEQLRLHDTLSQWRGELPEGHHSQDGLQNAKSFLERLSCRSEDAK